MIIENHRNVQATPELLHLLLVLHLFLSLRQRSDLHVMMDLGYPILLDRHSQPAQVVKIKGFATYAINFGDGQISLQRKHMFLFLPKPRNHRRKYMSFGAISEHSSKVIMTYTGY